MQQLIHHWYWARAQVGPYSLINAHIIAERAYGYHPSDKFLLTKQRTILADDESKVTFSEEDRFTDAATGKPVSNILRFVYQDGQQHYRIIYRRERDILRQRLVEEMPAAQRTAAEQAGFDGAYLRFTGPCQIERLEGGQVVEAVQQEAIWEMMYFGKASAPGMP